MPRRAVLREACSASLPPGSALTELIEVLVTHVLFFHQQMPCAFNDLKRILSDTSSMADGDPRRRRRRPGGAERKGAKLLTATNTLLAHLPAALTAITTTDAAAAAQTGWEPLVVAVVLGSSLTSPRLVYLLHVPHDGDARLEGAEGAVGAEGAAAAPRRDGGRRLLRAIATQCGALADVTPGLCKLHLLLRAPRDAALPAPHFRPRPGLVLKLKRAHLAAVSAASAPRSTSGSAGACEVDADPQAWCAGLVSGLSAEPRRSAERVTLPPQHADGGFGASTAPAGATENFGEDDPWIWWQSTARIKGYRLPSAGRG